MFAIFGKSLRELLMTTWTCAKTNIMGKKYIVELFPWNIYIYIYYNYYKSYINTDKVSILVNLLLDPP